LGTEKLGEWQRLSLVWISTSENGTLRGKLYCIIPHIEPCLAVFLHWKAAFSLITVNRFWPRTPGYIIPSPPPESCKGVTHLCICFPFERRSALTTEIQISLIRHASPQIIVVLLPLRIPQTILTLLHFIVSVLTQALGRAVHQAVVTKARLIARGFPPHCSAQMSDFDVLDFLTNDLQSVVRDRYLRRIIVRPRCKSLEVQKDLSTWFGEVLMERCPIPILASMWGLALLERVNSATTKPETYAIRKPWTIIRMEFWSASFRQVTVAA
jgi:hypothetical protein